MGTNITYMQLYNIGVVHTIKVHILGRLIQN